MKNILVTGAGALLGQGILRLLQTSNFEKKIYTADPDPRSSGHLLGDYALTVPKASDENYISELKKTVSDYKIDVILVGTDTELVKLAEVQNDFFNQLGCRIIVSPSRVITISNDKFLTAEFLRENNFPYPDSAMAVSYDNLSHIVEKHGYPLFAKPKDGARSLGLVKIENQADLEKIIHPETNMVVQQFLPAEGGEYTSGCIVLNGKCKSIVTLRRDLRDGNTYRTYRDADTSKYDDIIITIAERLDPEGPVNFQFRIDDGKPVIFEINGRFSGTTPLRSFYGFNEVEAILKYYLFNKDFSQPQLRDGVVLRAWSDVFVENVYLQKLTDSKEYANPHAEFFDFKLKA